MATTDYYSAILCFRADPLRASRIIVRFWMSDHSSSAVVELLFEYPPTLLGPDITALIHWA